MAATGYANPTAKAVALRTTLRVALRAHSLCNNRPERNENCATHVAGLKCYLCWRLQSRKAIARGKPGCLGCTCQTRVHSFATFAHGTAGAVGARLSLRPLKDGGTTKYTTRAKSSRGNERVCLPVIASEVFSPGT